MGYWSAWQDAYTFTYTVPRTDYNFTSMISTASDEFSGTIVTGAVTDGDGDIPALLTAELAAARAGSGGYTSGPRIGANSYAHQTGGNLGNDPIPITEGYGSTQVAVSQATATFNTAGLGLSNLDYYPPPLYDLTFGVDFALRPGKTWDDLDAVIQYEGDTYETTGIPMEGIFTGWNDWTLAFQSFVSSQRTGDASPAGPCSYAGGPDGFTVRVSAFLTPTSPSWFAAGAGTTLGTFTVAYDGAPNHVTYGSVEHTTIDMSAITVEGWTVVLQPSFLSALDPPIVDIPYTSDLSDNRSWAYGASVIVSQFVDASDPAEFRQADHRPEVNYLAPRWRYWIPISATILVTSDAPSHGPDTPGQTKDPDGIVDINQNYEFHFDETFTVHIEAHNVYTGTSPFTGLGSVRFDYPQFISAVTGTGIVIPTLPLSVDTNLGGPYGFEATSSNVSIDITYLVPMGGLSGFGLDMYFAALHTYLDDNPYLLQPVGERPTHGYYAAQEIFFYLIQVTVIPNLGGLERSHRADFGKIR